MSTVNRPKIRRGDTVKVLSGADRGRSGKVQQVLVKEQTAVVEGINERKKNVRARRQRQKGEIITFHAPVSITNLLLVCPKCHQPTRVHYHITGGTKHRICQHCKQVID